MKGAKLKDNFKDFRNVNFNYEKQNIEYLSGDIYKGKNYRCNYVRFTSLYSNPAPGNNQVLLYNYNPKGEVKASILVLHGLGSRNINFLFWMGPYLASRGINTTFLILPGNYSRVEDGSVSGRSYLYPDLYNQYRFWEHAVVDVRSTIDLLKQLDLWKENNMLVGYCLGGMVSTIVSVLESTSINHTLFVTTGGHIPAIMYDSPAATFVPRLISKGLKADFGMDNKDYLYRTYEEDMKKIEKMDLGEIISSKEIHPILKLDPLAYAHLLDVKKLTFIDGIFDDILPKLSSKGLLEQMPGVHRLSSPMNHVNWLPFSPVLARYIKYKLKKLDRKLSLRDINNQYENPVGK